MLGTKKPGLEDRAFCVSGAENRNRTYDLRVTSALLYRLSYFGLTVNPRGERQAQSAVSPWGWLPTPQI
jgi:hypothetical protein